MKNQRKGDLSSGILLLIFVLLLLGHLRPAFYMSQEPDSLCDTPFYVQIVGDTPKPGVYTLCRGGSLQEALAGSEVQINNLGHGKISGDNPLPSGTKIVIRPEAGSVAFEEMTSHHKMTLGIPIDVNRESREGLTALPGIGPALAARIVAERNKRGAFKGLGDLLSVKGLGPGLLQRIAPHVELVDL